MEPFTECPHCHGCAFKAGPHSGAALNLYCLHCGAGYNIVMLPDGYYLDQEIRSPTLPKELATTGG